MNHLAEETISRYLDNELPPTEREAVDTHIGECLECRRILVHWQAFDALSHEVYPTLSFAAQPRRNRLRMLLLAAAAGLCLMASIGVAWAAVTGRWPWETEAVETAPAPVAVVEQTPARAENPEAAVSLSTPAVASPVPEAVEHSDFGGTVSDLAGNPLPGARVTALAEAMARIAPPVQLGTASSDDTGHFKIQAPGMSGLLVQKKGYLPEVVNRVQSLRRMGAEIEVRLVRPYEQTLQLLDTSGNPIPGAGAKGVYEMYMGIAPSAVSDDSGLLKLALSYLEWPGQCIVAPPHATSIFEGVVFTSDTARPLTLGPGASLRVHLVRKGKPVPGAVVRLEAEVGRGAPPQWVVGSDAEGRAEFAGLAVPNEYKVTAQDINGAWPEVDSKAIIDAPEAGELTLEVSAEFPQMAEGKVLLPVDVDAATVRVYAEGYRYPVDDGGNFMAPQGARFAVESELLNRSNEALILEQDMPVLVQESPVLTLRVLDAAGAALEQVWMLNPGLFNGEQAFQCARLEADNGEIELVKSSANYYCYSPELGMGAFLDASTLTDEVVLNQPTGTFEGYVKLADGTPWKDVCLSIAIVHAARRFQWLAQTDNTGFFRFTDLPANESFKVSILGPVEIDAATLDRKFHASVTPTPVEFKVAMPRPRVCGQVVYSDGSPAARARVRLQYADREEMRESDWNGAFSVEPENGVELTALAGEDVESPPVYATAETKSVRLQLPITPDPEAQWAAVERAQRMNEYKQMGIVFKMFANEAANRMFPPMATDDNAFHPQRDLIYPEYLTDDSFFEWLEGEGTMYTGFALDSEAAGMAFLDAYQQLGAAGVSDVDLGVGAGAGTLGGETLYRLRESLPATDAAQSELPVIWELPGTRETDGGLVLYMDGHAEWVEYPGKFPMTESFVARVRELRGIAGEEMPAEQGELPPMNTDEH